MTLDLFAPTRRTYRCISIDPPWQERGGGKIKRGADRHYPLASREEIHRALAGAPFGPEDDAHLWCWVTDSFLLDGLWLIERLGFRYVRTFPWVKVRASKPAALDFETGIAAEGLVLSDDGTPAVKIGIGQYARGAHELLFFAVRGRGMSTEVWTGARDVPSVLFAPHERDESGKIIHSRKPRASYDLIERVSRGPRIEGFARIARPGWDRWGAEAPEGSEER